MPRIYELPAGAGPSSESLVIEHAPGSATAQRFNPQRQRQQQGSADPRQMLANQMDMELNNITREFDSQVSVIDQQQLEPDKYKAEYAKLQRRAMNQRVAIQAKHEAAANQIKNMQKLVEDKILTSEQMQSTMLVMAGVPSEHVRKMFAQQQRQKPSTQLNELASVAKKITNFRQQFDDGRPGWYKGKLKYTDPTGRKRNATEAETQAYDATTTQLAELDRAQQQIFNQLTPLEQYAQRGSRAVEQFGFGRTPSLVSQRFGGGIRMTEPAPKKKQLTAAELRKQGTEEAYKKGIKLGYWE